MRMFMNGLLVLTLVLGWSCPAQAEDKPFDIISKAIKAHGGEENFKKLKAVKAETKGKLELMGGLDFTQEVVALLPDKYKEVIHLEINGMKVTQTTVYNGTKGWINANGQNVPLNESMEEELKEAAYQLGVDYLPNLKDKKYELAAAGETKVKDKPAVGVRVSSKGHRDITLFFDKDTGLQVKTSHRTKDQMTGQEVTQETIHLEFQEVEGLKVAKKTLVNRDGKKFIEAEVLKIEFPDKVDDSEFAMP